MTTRITSRQEKSRKEILRPTRRRCLRGVLLGLCFGLMLSLSACGSSNIDRSNTLIYGSSDYTAINPALYEHGEINLLIFAGLTAHDGDNKVVPGLAESWSYDEVTKTWTFHLREGLTFHDGEPLTSEDVKFTIEAIQNPDNGSEIQSDYRDIEKISCPDKYTVKFQLKEYNAAFLDYMTVGILPKHLLEGKDLTTDEFNQHPVGAGPYKLTEWDEGQSITLEKFDGYYAGEANIETIIFRIIPDSASRLLQLESGDIDMAQLTPQDAAALAEKSDEYSIYEMETADYRALAYNFSQGIFKEYPELSNILSYGIDRAAIVKSVLLGQGEVAYSPIQKNKYNDDSIERFEYNPSKVASLLEAAGWSKNSDGWYEKDGRELAFTISAMADDQVRVDMANMCAEQLRKLGVHASAESVQELDWEGQDACIIGWGSPFDADLHTRKVFGTGADDNYTGYSNAAADRALAAAACSADDSTRQANYAEFLAAMTDQMPYTFLAYVHADYAVRKGVSGLTANAVLGHHGVGVFWNVADWTLEGTLEGMPEE